ncbi:hypothetical protein CA235_09540 [Sphingomonas sp. ABOLF]|nr:hypothetical protein CA235_09540 [Sphingomonas sp. ABOLF]
MSARDGLSAGDRVLFLGLGPKGQHGDVLRLMGRSFACVRFATGRPVLTRRADLHPIPRRPAAMW